MQHLSSSRFSSWGLKRWLELFFGALGLAAFVLLLGGCISSFNPKGGTTAGGTTVSISGDQLVGATAVMFGSTPATRFTVTSSTHITAVTKDHAAGTVEIQVVTPAGTFNSVGGFTFEVPPTITGFSPTGGSSLGATWVTITGTNFTDTTSVRFGSTSATRFTVTSPTTITALTENHPIGSVTVSVATYGGAATAPSDYTYGSPPPAPTITFFTPTSGSTSGGTTVTITGTHMTAAALVNLATHTVASFKVTSSTIIKAVTEAHLAATVPLKVTTPGGTASASSDYKYVAPSPTITSFTPPSGTTGGGTTVTVTGTGLYGATSVTFGATAGSFTVTSPTVVTARTRAHTAGPVKVKVTTAGGTGTSPGTFTFSASAPTIDTFTPRSGTTSGGTSVTISGTDLSGTTSVSFGSTTASFTVVTPTKVRATTRPHVAGAVKVKVITAGGIATSAGKFSFTAPMPTITSFSPTSGTTGGGTTVTLTGTGLYGATSVKFGSTTAQSFTVVAPTRITAVTKQHASGLVKVKVTTAGGPGTSQGTFTFSPPVPTITSFTPISGTTSGGTSVTITGTHLTATSAVAFGTQTAASFTITSPTQIKASTKAHMAATVAVKVTTPGGGATASVHYTFVTPPSVTMISSKAGPLAGGNHVLILGSAFRAGATVSFGGTPASSVVLLSSTLITAVAPSHAVGPVTVVVTTTSGSSGPGKQYTYDPVPSLTKISPNKGPTLGLNTLTLTGLGFVTGATVTFESSTATPVSTSGTTVVVVTSTEIQVTTPAHATGPVTVLVTTPGGISLSGTSSTKYTFVPPPVLTKVTPGAGSTAGGNTVTLTGQKFFSAASVSFGGAAGTTARVTSSTKISVKAPAHAAGTVTVTITTIGGTSDAIKYAFGVPSIASITPAGGNLTGGTTATVTGAQFAAGASVSFGGQAAHTVTVLSPTSLTVKAPSHTAGTVTVTVTTPAGTSAPVHFTYYAKPTMSSITPSGGPVAGGNAVTLTGTNFGTGAQVFFGTTAGKTVVVDTTTKITLDAPAHRAGTVTVTVRTLGGLSGKLAYVFYPSPVVTTVTPAAGPTAGGTSVSLRGAGLASATKVSFGAVTASTFRIVTTGTIAVTAPPHAAGLVTVIVTTQGGTSAAGRTFTYAAAPTLTSVTPSGGPVGGANTAIITGTSFVAGSTISFGGKSGSTVAATGTTKIRVKAPTHVAGAVTVTVTTPGGTSPGIRYVYGPPTVTKITEDAGPSVGGTTVTLSGTGFITSATVTFGGAAGSTVVVTSTTSITVKTPAHSSGTVTVVVHTNGGASAPVTFVYGAPTLTKITPAGGNPVGHTSVTLTGTGFAGPAAVVFGGSEATTVVVVSSTTITAKTPSHAAGSVTVTVSTGGGTSGGVSFTYDAVPTVTSVSPGATKTTGGTTVTVTGTGLLAETTVSFGGVQGTTVHLTGSTKITTKAPAHAVGKVTVTVTDSGGTSVGVPFIYGPPTLTSVTPNSGKSTGGTPVTLMGSGFAAPATVLFGSTPATTVQVTNTSKITAKIPPHAPGTVSVTVGTAGGSATSKYTYVARAPTVVSLTPSTGPTTGGTVVTITGTNFEGTGFAVTGVKFGTFTPPSSFTVTSPTTITAVTPPHVADAENVVVVNTQGTRWLATGPRFDYRIPAPTITKYAPTTGVITGGTTVTITGSNFAGQTISVSSIEFGTTPAASFTVTNSKTIKAVSPARAPGLVRVKVTTTGGTATVPYEYLVPPPTITSYTPTAGVTTGGTTVTVTGTGFTGVSSVGFGVTWVAEENITNAITSAQAIYTTNGGSFPTDATDRPTTSQFMAELHATQTAITFVTRTTRPTEGRNSVGVDEVTPTLAVFTAEDGYGICWAGAINDGTSPIDNIVPGMGFRGMKLSATACDALRWTETTTTRNPGWVRSFQRIGIQETEPESFTVTSATTITVVTPPHEAGTFRVKVTAAGGTAVSADHFTFVAPPPAITSLTPTSGTTSGGTLVSITGTGLYTPHAVEFGTEPVESFTSTRPTTITAVTYAHAAGTVTVKVVTTGGTATAPTDYKYVAPVPTVTSFTPTSGSVIGGTTVTITGTGFIGASTVKFGSTGTSTFTVTSPTTIRAVTGPHGAGTVSIRVTTPGGSATSSTSYKFAAPVPTISSVAPSEGPTTGGTSVTIAGTGLYGATAVKFGTTTAASFKVTGPTKLTAVTEPHATGGVSVKVTTGGGTANGAFDFLPVAPTVSSLTPTLGTSSGGTVVTVVGTSFLGPTSVKFGTTTAASVKVTSSTHLTVVTKAHPTGTVTVKVTTPYGTATASSDFKFSSSSTTACYNLVPKNGAHSEALLGFQPTVAPKLTTVTVGGTAAILFLDEGPTHTSPDLCVQDATGVRSLLPLDVTVVNYYGASQTDPFLSGVTAATEAGGSGPNADSPPAPGSYCNTPTFTPPSTFPGTQTDPPSSCAVEVRLVFKVPAVNPNDRTSPVVAMTFAAWDRETDLDVYTWNVAALTAVWRSNGSVGDGTRVAPHQRARLATSIIPFGTSLNGLSAILGTKQISVGLTRYERRQ